MEFRGLGPLEVDRDGRPLRLGGVRQRALLALLLVHVNQLVPTEVLVDQLFGEERSETAVNAIRVAMSRLRRVLHDGDQPTVLRTHPGGYELVLDVEQVDFLCFERDVSAGRRLLEGGDPAAAAGRLRGALAMWRGAPFADLRSLEFLTPEIERQEELRRAAMLERVDADLALLYRDGRQSEALAVYRRVRRRLSDELGLEPGPAQREVERRILNQDSGLADVSSVPEATPAVQVCPFKGLASFEGSDSEFFCGREQSIADLLARLVESPVVGVVGPSGVGKSSVLRAGVLPALAAGALPGSGRWSQVLARPGERPSGELRRALGDVEPERALNALDPAERLVFAIDQLEELFTVCTSGEDRLDFLEQLVRLGSDPQRRAVVVVCLRADFYRRCASHPEFARLLSANHLLLTPMDRAQLTQAICEPAARAGLELEPELVRALIDDVSDAAGGLPLLSTSLLELWRERTGQTLRLADYQRTGGVRGAVARLAESRPSPTRGCWPSPATRSRWLTRHCCASGRATAPGWRRIGLGVASTPTSRRARGNGTPTGGNVPTCIAARGWRPRSTGRWVTPRRSPPPSMSSSPPDGPGLSGRRVACAPGSPESGCSSRSR